MDDTSLTPLSLFSPSKAAAHRALAHDWAYLETHLHSLYRAPPPPIERTPSTLSSLLALCTFNETADTRSTHLAQAQRAALIELENSLGADEEDIPASVLLQDRITSALDEESRTALRSWAATSTLLNAPSPSAESVAHELISLLRTQSVLTAHSTTLENLHQTLAAQLERTEKMLSEIQSAPELKGAAGNLPQKTAEMTRQTKHLRAKIGEYEARLGALGADESPYGGQVVEPLSGAGITSLVQQEEDVEVLKEQVEKLEAQVEAFAGLPEDPEAARQKVRRLEKEVEKLRARRDRLFEEMVDK